MIFGKSNHPVQIKKIDLEIWEFRDELEYIISKSLKEIKTQGSGKINLNLIREYYSGKWIWEGGDEDEAASPLDVAGNLMEGDADPDKNSENPDENSEENPETPPSPEDLEAAATENDETTDQAEDKEAELAATEKEDDSKDGETAEDQVDIKNIFIEKILKPGTLRVRPDLPAKKIKKGKIVLSDINIDGALFFCTEDFLSGKSLVIRLVLPQAFVLSCEIVSCKRFNFRTRIISENRMDFRLHAKFTFLSKGERTKLRQFLASIQPEIPKDEPRRQQVEDDEDDFDDFEDLGL